MPKVSVIIATYNCAKYICETIESVLKQTYQDYEIIIIDSSNDNTKKIVQVYIDKYPEKIRYLYQIPLGTGAARNKGIIESSGEYIANLEDDIWTCPEKLEWQVKIMDENPDAGMTFTDAEIFDQNRVIEPRWWNSTEQHKQGSFRWKMSQMKINDGAIIKENLFNDLLLGNFIPSSSILIRKKYLEYIGYFDPRLLNDDFDMSLRISERFPIIFLNRVTLKYRYREDSTSGKTGLREARYCEFDAKSYEKLVKKYSQLNMFLIQRISFLHRLGSWRYLNFGELNKSRELAIRSLSYNKFQLRLYLYILFSFLPEKVTKFIIRIKKNNLKNSIRFNQCRKLA